MLCFEVGVLKWSPQRKGVSATVRLVLQKRTLGWSSGRNVKMKVKVKRGRAGNKRKVNSRILEIIHIGPRRFMVKYLPWKYVQIFQKFIIKTQPIRILISELLWGWKTIVDKSHPYSIWDEVNLSSVESVVWTSSTKRVWENIWRGFWSFKLYFLLNIFRVHEPKEQVQPSKYKCDRCSEEFESKVSSSLKTLSVNILNIFFQGRFQASQTTWITRLWAV